MNSKNLIIPILISTIFTSAFAESKSCSDYYKELLPQNGLERAIDYFDNVTGPLMATSVIGVGISVVGSTGGLVSVSGAGLLTSGVAGLSGELSDIKQRVQLNNLNELQKQASLGDGALLREVRVNAVQEDPTFNLSLTEVADLVLVADKVGIGCTVKQIDAPDTKNCRVVANAKDADVVCAMKKTAVLDQYVPASKMHEVIIKLSE